MFVTIFVEGNETLFLYHLIRNLDFNIKEENIKIDELSEPKPNEICVNIINTKGFTSLGLNTKYFQQTVDRGGVNLVIFDADDSSKDFGGFESRMKYLEEKKTELSLTFDTFLFPDNKSDGDFESLLESIVPEKHRQLLGCFDKYQNCISRITHEDGTTYELPIRKSKIYSYVNAIKKTKVEEKRFKNRDKGSDDFLFERTDIWDLNREGISPLKNFLLKYLRKNVI